MSEILDHVLAKVWFTGFMLSVTLAAVILFIGWAEANWKVTPRNSLGVILSLALWPIALPLYIITAVVLNDWKAGLGENK